MPRLRTIIILAALALPFSVAGQMYPLLIGSYTGPGKNKGINTAVFDSQSGTIVPTQKFAPIDNPSFLAVSADGKFVYSVNESGNKSGVSAFQLDETQTDIKLINRVSMPSLDPCYIIASRNHVITANYSSGDISVFPIAADGSLKELSQTVTHEGKSVNPTRQSKPHAHMVMFTPDQRHLLVSDLGLDKIMLYAYNENSDEPLRLINSFDVPAGAGPRHMAFSADNTALYVLGELDGNIYVYSFADNVLTLKNAYSSIFPTREVEDFGGADLHLSPDGNFLYASIRAKENIIAVFEVQKDFTLKPIQQSKTDGLGPRNFTISPDGAWLLVAHQNSNSIIVFSRDDLTGKLSTTGNYMTIAAPVNLILIP